MGSALGKGGGDTISPAEILDLTRQQQVMNNPNVSNIFGNTSTTFDANDQAHITQTMSPEMRELVNMQMDFVGQGAQQYNPPTDSYNQGMQQRFEQNMADRSGFQMPERAIPQFNSPTPVDPNQPMPDGLTQPIDSPQPFPDSGIGSGYVGRGGGGGNRPPNEMDVPPVTKPSMGNKAKQFANNYAQGSKNEELNPLAKALMQIGGR